MFLGVNSFPFGGDVDGFEFQACKEKARDVMVRLARAAVFDHRKVWIEEYLQQFAAAFGIDLLGYADVSTCHHKVLCP